MDSERLAERARTMFGKISALPDGPLSPEVRAQLFDALDLLSSNIRCELMDTLREAGDDPRRLGAVSEVLNVIDNFQLKTKMDALMFVTECLGLAQLLPYAKFPATPAIVSVPAEVFEQMYDTMRIFASLIVDKQGIISHDDLCRSIYGDTIPSNRSKLTQLASRANKFLKPYGEIMGVYGKGYIWQPKIIAPVKDLD